MEGLQIIDERYRLDKIFSRTAVATIYRAYDLISEKSVLVKLYSRQVMFGWSQFARINQMLDLIQSPVVLPMLGHGLWNEQIYTVIPEMPQTLESKLKHSKLSFEIATKILYQLVLGLRQIHGVGVFHQNITPANILLDEQDKPYLTDFGITRLVETDVYKPIHLLLGNPRYMHSKQLLGESDTGWYNDIYSLGLIYYEMLMGKPLYDKALLPLQAGFLQVFDPIDTRKHLQNVPKSARSILAKMIQNSIGDTPAITLDEIAKQLERFFKKQERELIQRQSISQRIKITNPIEFNSGRYRKSAHRNNLVWIIAGLTLLAVLILGWQITRPDNPIGNFRATSTQAESISVVQHTNTAVAIATVSATETKTSTPPTATATNFPIPTSRIEMPVENTPTVQPTATIPPLLTVGGANKIAFISQNDVWVANIDGSNLERLTVDEKVKTNLQWSEDGQSLIYQVDGRQQTVAFQDGSVNKDISSNRPCTLSVAGRMVKYSRNGRRASIVVQTAADGLRTEVIEVYEFDENCNTKKIDVFPPPRFEMRGYSEKDATRKIDEYDWDGNELFLLHGNFFNGMGDLVIYNFTLKQAQVINPVNDGRCCYRDIGWSPDGQYIYFAYQDIRYAEDTQIYYVPYGLLQGGSTIQPLSLPEYILSDPRSRAYTTLRKSPSYNQQQIVVQQTKFTYPLDSGGANKLAFLKAHDIWIVNFDGSELERITFDGTNKRHLQWSPDGRVIFYQDDDCTKAINILTKQFLDIGCFSSLAIAPDAQRMIVSDNVLFPDNLERPLAKTIPYNLALLQQFNTYSLLDVLGSCPSMPASFYRWSANNVMALLISTAQGGRNVETVQVMQNLQTCGLFPTQIDAFPQSRFELAGYSESAAAPLLYDFAWNGDTLFAVNGNQNDGFGKIFVYDTKLGKGSYIAPLQRDCCYRDMQWSPDGSFFLFAIEDALQRIKIYYGPYLSQSPDDFQAIPLPPEFFLDSDPRFRLYPALRPKISVDLTQYYSGKVPVELPEKLFVQTTIAVANSPVFSLAFSNDGTKLASGDSITVKTWAVATGELLQSYDVQGTTHTNIVTAVHFTPDQQGLASASLDSTISVRRLSTGAPLLKIDIEKNDYAILDMQYSPDGKWIASAYADGAVRMHRSHNAGPRFLPHTHTGPVYSLVFSQDTQFLLSASADHTIRLWSLKDGKEQEQISVGNTVVADIALSQADQWLAAALWDGTIVIWDFKTRTVIHTLRIHSAPVMTLDFSPDGKYLAAGSQDGSISLWHVQDASLLAFTDTDAAIFDLQFSPADSWFATANADGKIILWRWSEGN